MLELLDKGGENNMFTTIDKALIPVIVGIIITALAGLGINSNMSVQDLVTLAVSFGVTAFGVYLTPNKKND